MSRTDSSVAKPNRELEKVEIRISQLVPGERILSRQSIDRWKSIIESGEFDGPTVTKVMDVYFVTQGNHRVFAAKEIGLTSLTCQVRKIKRQQNVAAQDDVDCSDARKAGLLGFEGLSIVATDQDRERACKEEALEEDPIFDDLFGEEDS
jgi:hypothetical protein